MCEYAYINFPSPIFCTVHVPPDLAPSSQKVLMFSLLDNG